MVRKYVGEEEREGKEGERERGREREGEGESRRGWGRGRSGGLGEYLRMKVIWVIDEVCGGEEFEEIRGGDLYGWMNVDGWE